MVRREEGLRRGDVPRRDGPDDAVTQNGSSDRSLVFSSVHSEVLVLRDDVTEDAVMLKGSSERSLVASVTHSDSMSNAYACGPST